MENFSFSYHNYKKICQAVKATGRLRDYRQVLEEGPEAFIILRHDVEFSPDRALGLGRLESQMGLRSTFFFQVTNNAYNILSKKNLDIVMSLERMGHRVGLHFHLNGMDDLMQIRDRIAYEIGLLRYYTGLEIDRFSFHRPTPLVLRANIELPGIINAYGPAFFTYFEEGEAPPGDMVKYVADSKNRWQYTAPFRYPCQAFFEAFPKIQILCHPYSWTQEGHDIADNLRSLLEENRREFLQTMNGETKYVREYIDAL